MEKSFTTVKEIQIFGYGSAKTLIPGPIYRGEFHIQIEDSMVFAFAIAVGEKDTLINGQKQCIKIGNKIIIPISNIMYMDDLCTPEPTGEKSQETK